MSTGAGDSSPAGGAGDLRALDTPGARDLAALAATFADLQTVLRCCELLVARLAEPAEEHDGVSVEALWTTALLSYARCFGGPDGTALTENDVAGTHVSGQPLDWHRVLMQLRDHYADAAVNPREQYAVAVARDRSGAPEGVALTSARQPLVDDLTVRQTGAIAYALAGLVDERMARQQEVVFGEVRDLPPGDLAALPVLDVVRES